MTFKILNPSVHGFGGKHNTKKKRRNETSELIPLPKSIEEYKLIGRSEI